MSRLTLETNIARILDANLNRAKEGLRVCEEIARFILINRPLSRNLKQLRHKIEEIINKNFDKNLLLKGRNSSFDIGKNIFVDELKRSNCQDIFFANIQRVKESLRVLEEFSKLTDANIAVEFKKLRYKSYGIEKGFGQKIANLKNK